MRTFHLEIVTLDGSVFDGEVESLLVHTDDGDVEILAGHADLLAALDVGRARIRADGKNRYASSAGGFLSVDKGGARLVAVTFEFAEDIDLERARRAKENAEAAIAKAQGERELALAKAKLQRALNRIGIAELI